MNEKRCGDIGCRCSRRGFMLGAGGAALSWGLWRGAAGSPAAWAAAAGKPIAPMGPAARCTPRMKAAFVRRKGEYGMRWPGAIYDGEAALKMYREGILAGAKELGITVDLRPAPIYSLEEGEQWVAEAEAEKHDGLLLVLLDRQEHSWPTAGLAVDSAIPAIIFAPIGAAFTTNTAPIAKKPGAVICSTDDFEEAVWGMKMIKAGAKLRETRVIVIKGRERNDTSIAHFGTKLRYIPAATFLEVYRQTPMTDEVKAIAAEYLENAERIVGASEQDVYNGVKSYLVARSLLEREEGDAITMDCLGALGKSEVSLPCIAWSRMNDEGVPAACEADLGACVTHALVQYLFDRPGFQQDPVPDTATECIIGAHCTCATRLAGFEKPPEPYYLSHHHGNRDAVPVPLWRPGQRVTVADVLLSNEPDKPPAMLISTGEVVGNVSVPPSGGCVVSVRIKVDGLSDALSYPGFHQIFFYGDFKKELARYCRLHGLQAQFV